MKVIISSLGGGDYQEHPPAGTSRVGLRRHSRFASAGTAKTGAHATIVRALIILG